MVSWTRKKQTFIALNTAEAEFIACCLASYEAIWIYKIIVGLFDQV